MKKFVVSLLGFVSLLRLPMVFAFQIDADSDDDGILDTQEKIFCGENINTQTIKGNGNHKKDVVFFSWTGLNINGTDLNAGTGDVSQFIHNGVVYKAEIKKVERSSNFPIKADKIDSFLPAYAHQKYNPAGNNDAISFAFTSVASGTFDIEFTATKNGVVYPIEILVMDGQVTNHNHNNQYKETLQFRTSGTPFTLFEELGGTTGNNQAISGENTSTIQYFNSRHDDKSMPNRNAIFSTIGGTGLVISTSASRIKGRQGTQAAAYAVLLPCDIDDDGLPNYLDTDSDNDGCPDAIEGTGTIAADSVDANGAITGDIDSDGVPELAKGGQGIGKSQLAGKVVFDAAAPNTGKPVDVSIKAGENGTFSATGLAITTTGYTLDNQPDYANTTTGIGTIKYQWYAKTGSSTEWKLLTNQTGKYFTVSDARASDVGTYKVEISCEENICQTESAEATLALTNLNNTLSFEKNGGEGTMSVETHTGDAVLNLTKNTFTHTGYTFSGWNTIEDASGTGYSDQGSFIMPYTGVVLYAQWNINTYTLSFKTNGGTSVQNQEIAYNGTGTKPADPSKAGSLFKGWYSDNGLTTEFDFTGSLITGDTAVYAKWQTKPSGGISGGSGGGRSGGGVKRDDCPNGDHSPSLYDGTCGNIEHEKDETCSNNECGQETDKQNHLRDVQNINKDIFNPDFEGYQCHTLIDETTIYQGNNVSDKFRVAHQMLYSYEQTKWRGTKDFAPKRKLTREEAARFMVEFAKKVLCRKPNYTYSNQFVDIEDADPTLKNYIKESYEYKIFHGDGGGASHGEPTTFRPKDEISYDELAAVLVRLVSNEFNEPKSGGNWASYYKTFVTSHIHKTTQQTNHREHVAEVIYDMYRLNHYDWKDIGFVIQK